MNANFNPTSNPLNYMMVETWDDYEEGTEIETGIGYAALKCRSSTVRRRTWRGVRVLVVDAESRFLSGFAGSE